MKAAVSIRIRVLAAAWKADTPDTIGSASGLANADRYTQSKPELRPAREKPSPSAPGFPSRTRRGVTTDDIQMPPLWHLIHAYTQQSPQKRFHLQGLLDTEKAPH